MENLMLENFEKVFNKKPDFYIDAGGRFEVIGNHTDHNHGLCIVANAGLRIKAVVKKCDKKVRIKSKGYKFFSIDLRYLKFNAEDEKTPMVLCKGILYKMKSLGYKVGGFEAYIESEIPNGSGVSSSAAFETLIGNIISYLYNDGKIPEIVIAKVGQFSENKYFGKPCGLLDQIGTAFSGVNYLDFKDIDNPQIKALTFDLPVTIFLIKSSGNHSNLTRLYTAIPRAMHKVANALENKKYLRDVDDNNIYDRINAISVPDYIKNKAKHFFIECKNVKNCCAAIEEKNLENFFDAIRKSQSSSKENLENTFIRNQYKNSPQNIIDIVSDFLGENGAVRIHGGGFKGTVICFVKNEFENEFENYIKSKLKNNKFYKTKISNNSINFKELN